MKSSTSLAQIIHVDEQKCINCHQCISVCPVKYCNDGSGDYIKLNPDLCIGCGECIDACDHDARIALDDFSVWMKDVKKGIKMIAVVAPAVAANFPGKYLQLNGWLKSIGVKGIFDVSFGAELTIKSYLNYLQKNSPDCIISQPCPAIVNYIEIYKPELIKYLAPADSPMMHTMKMIKHFYHEYSGYKIAVISPCIAKKREFEEVGIGDYNITMKKMLEYFEEQKIPLDKYSAVDYDNPPAERAVLFSTPGGLMRTAIRENPEVVNITRKIEGPGIVYHYFDALLKDINNKIAPVLIDCLNCEAGCNGGTGTERKKSLDEIEHLIEERNIEMQKKYSGRINKKPSLRKIRKVVNKLWKEDLYVRTYVDRSSNLNSSIKKPSAIELEKIYALMKKENQEDYKNCASCGYDNCEKMAIAIFNNLNKVSNCHVFLEKTENYVGANLPFVEKLAEGDLTVMFIDEGHSEIAKFFQKLNQVLRNICSIISSTVKSVESTAHLSKQISSSTNQMTTGSRQQSEQTAEIATAIEEMTKTIVETTRNASAAAQNAKKAGLIASEGGKVVEDTVDGIGRISEVVKIAAGTVKKLGSNSDQIGEIIQVIDDIADQTNLLALNAAIEAARAGEQGRGFAVVADEVRKLAERTTKATKEIADMIKQIQKDTSEAVESMNKGTEEVEKGRELANNAGESLKEIITASTRVLDDVTQVASASEEQSATAEQVSQSIEAISNVTNETAAGIQQVARAAEDLNKLTDNLQNLISRFKTEAGESESGYAVRQNGKLIER